MHACTTSKLYTMHGFLTCIMLHRGESGVTLPIPLPLKCAIKSSKLASDLHQRTRHDHQVPAPLGCPASEHILLVCRRRMQRPLQPAVGLLIAPRHTPTQLSLTS